MLFYWRVASFQIFLSIFYPEGITSRVRENNHHNAPFTDKPTPSTSPKTAGRCLDCERRREYLEKTNTDKDNRAEKLQKKCIYKWIIAVYGKVCKLNCFLFLGHLSDMLDHQPTGIKGVLASSYMNFKIIDLNIIFRSHPCMFHTHTEGLLPGPFLGLSVYMNWTICHVICGEWTGHYQQSAIDPRLRPRLLFICNTGLAPSINERNLTIQSNQTPPKSTVNLLSVLSEKEEDLVELRWASERKIRFFSHFLLTFLKEKNTNFCYYVTLWVGVSKRRKTHLSCQGWLISSLALSTTQGSW